MFVFASVKILFASKSTFERGPGHEGEIDTSDMTPTEEVLLLHVME